MWCNNIRPEKCGLMITFFSKIIEYGLQQRGNYPNWVSSQFEYNTDCRFTNLKIAKEELDKARKGFPFLQFRLVKIIEIKEILEWFIYVISVLKDLIALTNQNVIR